MENFSDLNIKGVLKLSPLELNNIRLSVKHTILTPQYLDNLVQSDPDNSEQNNSDQTDSKNK